MPGGGDGFHSRVIDGRRRHYHKKRAGPSCRVTPLCHSRTVLPETRIYEEALMAEAGEGRLGSECLGLIERQVGVDRSAISKAGPPPALLGQSHIDGSHIPHPAAGAPRRRHDSVTAPVRMSGTQSGLGSGPVIIDGPTDHFAALDLPQPDAVSRPYCDSLLSPTWALTRSSMSKQA